MTHYRLAIDDPEVRQRHRLQIRRYSVSMVLAVLAVWCVLYVITAGAMWCHLATAPRVAASVVSVDLPGDVVVVRYFDRRAVRSAAMAVDDASAYSPGDQVQLLFDSEDGQPETPDRESFLPLLIDGARCFGPLVAASMVAAIIACVRDARARRRALSSPWQHVHGEAWGGGGWYAFLPHVDDGSCWNLSESLASAGPFEADVAGDMRKRLVMRVAGSTDLVIGRRSRTQVSLETARRMVPTSSMT